MIKIILVLVRTTALEDAVPSREHILQCVNVCTWRVKGILHLDAGLIKSNWFNAGPGASTE